MCLSAYIPKFRMLWLLMWQLSCKLTCIAGSEHLDDEGRLRVKLLGLPSFCRSFLPGACNCPTIICFWQLMDQHALLQSSKLTFCYTGLKEDHSDVTTDSLAKPSASIYAVNTDASGARRLLQETTDATTKPSMDDFAVNTASSGEHWHDLLPCSVLSCQRHSSFPYLLLCH